MIFMIVDQIEIVNQALGAIRNALASILNLKDPNVYKFL